MGPVLLWDKLPDTLSRSAIVSGFSSNWWQVSEVKTRWEILQPGSKDG